MSILDVIGPIIVGPSSSHTAGAVKMGRFAHNYIGKTPQEVKFFLHGSFAETYIGHGTDRALLGGIMGLDLDDPRIKNAFKIAEDVGLKYEFIPADLGDVHPNTIKIVSIENDIEYQIIACSVGAAEIIITEIDGNTVNLNAKNHTLVIKNKDEKGALGEIMKLIAFHNINVANVYLKRLSKALKEAVCVIELDEEPTLFLIKDFESNEKIIKCSYIPKI
jgi:L-serine dehydratase